MPLDSSFPMRRRGHAIPSRSVRVSLFITCLADQLFPEVGVSTVRLLRRLGCEVSFDPAQTCCGQPQHNAGEPAMARRIARTWIQAFDRQAGLTQDEFIVTPSGSCASMVRHGYAALFDDSEERARAARLAERTFELSQFLVNVLRVEDVGARCDRRATYMPSCHAMRGLGVRDEPLRLLSQVRGLSLSPLANASDCCGFGGLFSVGQPAISGAMVDEKASCVQDSGAQLLIGTDMGCLMNVAGRLRARGSSIEVAHLAQVLEAVDGPR